MSEKWYHTHDGDQAGPFTLDQMNELIRTGRLDPTDLVWNPSVPEWAPAQDYAELRFAEASSPASPPPEAAPTTADSPLPAPAPARVVRYQVPDPATGVLASAHTLELLRQGRPWAQFIAVLLYCFGTLFVAVALIAGCSTLASPKPGGFTLGMFFGYFLTGAFQLVPGFFLSRYVAALGRLQGARSTDALESAMQAQRAFWRITGILALAIVAIGVLTLMIAMMISV